MSKLIAIKAFGRWRNIGTVQCDDDPKEIEVYITNGAYTLHILKETQELYIPATKTHIPYDEYKYYDNWPKEAGSDYTEIIEWLNGE